MPLFFYENSICEYFQLIATMMMFHPQWIVSYLYICTDEAKMQHHTKLWSILNNDDDVTSIEDCVIWWPSAQVIVSVLIMLQLTVTVAPGQTAPGGILYIDKSKYVPKWEIEKSVKQYKAILIARNSYQLTGFTTTTKLKGKNLILEMILPCMFLGKLINARGVFILLTMFSSGPKELL